MLFRNEYLDTSFGQLLHHEVNLIPDDTHGLLGLELILLLNFWKNKLMYSEKFLTSRVVKDLLSLAVAVL